MLEATLGVLLVIFQPGTQPGDLDLDLRDPSVCRSCHGAFGEYAPNDAWEGTMMANATRDPLFHAALAVANQDVPGGGDLCLRCHTPRGWLFERSEPTDGSLLEPGDFEGVSCDFCHRLRYGRGEEHFIGNARYIVADDYIRRGPLSDAQAPHDTLYSAYFESSELCGLCHDVSNPLENGFAIERTFSEWKASAYPAEGKNCQSCHLPEQEGVACGARGSPVRTVHRHELAGGNSWMPLVFAGEFPELEREVAYQRTAAAAVAQLERAAAVSVSAPAEAEGGGRARVTVRVENLTGHKLPTGYPEGRRSWLELEVVDAAGTVVFDSGAYDAEEARRVEDPQLRTYEVRMAADGMEGFHFIKQDELLQDNRIPPRGFVPAPDTAPVGRRYPRQPDGTLASWDEAPYEFDVPEAAVGPLTVTATLWYQTTSRDYVEFLRAENRTNDRGDHMVELWEAYGRAPPVAMAAATATVEVPASEGGCSVAPAWGRRDETVTGIGILVFVVLFCLRLSTGGKTCERSRLSRPAC